MEEHLEEKTDKISLYYCTECKYKTKRNCTLIRHFRNMHSKSKDSQQHECAECGYTTKYKHALTRHTKIVHPSDLNPPAQYDCQYCNYTCCYISNLNRHLSGHKQSKEFRDLEYKFVCPDCGFASIHQYTMDRHTASVHEKRRPFSCDLCAYQTSTVSNLRRHLLAHVGQAASQTGAGPGVGDLPQIVLERVGDCFLCKVCDTRVSGIEELQSHLTVAHSILVLNVLDGAEVFSEDDKRLVVDIYQIPQSNSTICLPVYNIGNIQAQRSERNEPMGSSPGCEIMEAPPLLEDGQLFRVDEARIKNVEPLLVDCNEGVAAEVTI